MLNLDDTKILALMEAYTENIKATKDKSNHDYYIPRVEQGSKYLRFDYGHATSPGHNSGHWMINRETEQVYAIKGYGVPNLKKPHGTVDQMIANLKLATERHIDYMHTYWYAIPSHPLA